MNPFAAVEPIGAARGPLATLAALANALAGFTPPPPMGEAGMDMQGVTNGLANEASTGTSTGVNTGLTTELSGPINVPINGPTHGLMNGPMDGPANTLAQGQVPLAGALPAAVTSAQAMQGRSTLGQLAAEPTAWRTAAEMPTSAIAAEASRSLPLGTLAPEAGNTRRPSDALAVPVLLSPPFTTAGHAARAREAPEPTAARHREAEWLRLPTDSEAGAEAGSEGGSAEPDLRDDNNAAADPDPGGASTPSRDPEAAALRALLQRAEQVEALRELALGRRVLLVLPQAGGGPGAASASAAMLTSDQVQRFGARWWPGTANATRPGWLRWRVFRSGDPQLDSGLRSRCASTACHLRLGAHVPHLADAGTAQVELAERIRFAQALGAQWSLLVVAAPPEAFA